MVTMTDKEFETAIAEAMDSLPERFMEHAKNVAIVWADQPTSEQRIILKLRGNESLYGLYEGIPLTSRGNNYNLVLPDKITIFKVPILSLAHTILDVNKQVKHTLWHEIAHHYGLDHDKIHKIEDNWQ